MGVFGPYVVLGTVSLKICLSDWRNVLLLVEALHITSYPSCIGLYFYSVSIYIYTIIPSSLVVKVCSITFQSDCNNGGRARIVP